MIELGLFEYSISFFFLLLLFVWWIESLSDAYKKREKVFGGIEDEP